MKNSDESIKSLDKKFKLCSLWARTVREDKVQCSVILDKCTKTNDKQFFNTLSFSVFVLISHFKPLTEIRTKLRTN